MDVELFASLFWFASGFFFPFVSKFTFSVALFVDTYLEMVV